MGENPLILTDGTRVQHSPLFCERCGDALDPDLAVWLELDRETNLYHDQGRVPVDRSQGMFSFGRDCAKAVIRNGGKNITLSKRRKRG